MNLLPGQKLSVGQPYKVPVSAREDTDTMVDTGIDMAPGEQYELAATGLWWDFFIPSSPNGFFFLPDILVNRFLRHRPSNFFALIGCLDRRPDQQFFVGKHCNYKPEVPGRLFCFANDVSGFYWNNWGKVDLTIKRLH
ncbi:MAG: hypothetical protein WAN46_17370 [Gammaproteobacteria bacterium]|jgi:hypothetical protein